jgi:hypothetical protein
MSLYGYKVWHEFDSSAGLSASSLLNEVARHMENGYEHRNQPKSARFNAGHQLAHKGWRFPAGLYDVATGQMTSGIKAIRALIVSDKASWFRSASFMAMGDLQVTTPADVSDLGARQFVASVSRGEQLYRLEGPEWVILMCPTTAGWRIAGIVVRDAEAAGIKDALVMSAAMSPGCLIPALGLVACAFSFALGGI